MNFALPWSLTHIAYCNASKPLQGGSLRGMCVSLHGRTCASQGKLFCSSAGWRDADAVFRSPSWRLCCGRCCRLKECSHIFMRWKEQAFAKSGDDCGLTIAGFYYICLCRQTGDVEGETSSE